MVFYKKDSNIKTLEEMIKTCLLPEKMFYHKKILPKENDIKKISSITDKPKKTEQQKNKEETKNKPNIIPKISDPKNIETKKEEQKIIVKKNDENEIKKIEDKKEGNITKLDKFYHQATFISNRTSSFFRYNPLRYKA